MMNSNSIEYKVVCGDSLWSIANKFLGDPERWPEIWFANLEKIPNPDHIRTDQILTINDYKIVNENQRNYIKAIGVFLINKNIQQKETTKHIIDLLNKVMIEYKNLLKLTNSKPKLDLIEIQKVLTFNGYTTYHGCVLNQVPIDRIKLNDLVYSDHIGYGHIASMNLCTDSDGIKDLDVVCIKWNNDHTSEMFHTWCDKITYIG